MLYSTRKFIYSFVSALLVLRATRVPLSKVVGPLDVSAASAYSAHVLFEKSFWEDDQPCVTVGICELSHSAVPEKWSKAMANKNSSKIKAR
jgi:hypothetical protein